MIHSKFEFKLIDLFQPKMLKNAESIAAREKDRHFVAKHALKWYELFARLYPRVLDDAIEHFKKTGRIE